MAEEEDIMVHCDNRAVVHGYQAKSVKHPALLQNNVVLIAARNNLLRQLARSKKKLADALSRQQVQQLGKLHGTTCRSHKHPCMADRALHDSHTATAKRESSLSSDIKSIFNWFKEI